VGRVVTIEIIFLQQWRVGVERFEEGGLLCWCGFNTSVSARQGRRWDEALPEDEAEAMSLSWFNGNEAWHGAAA
jgi:hypothetical protein